MYKEHEIYIGLGSQYEIIPYVLYIMVSIAYATVII